MRAYGTSWACHDSAELNTEVAADIRRAPFNVIFMKAILKTPQSLKKASLVIFIQGMAFAGKNLFIDAIFHRCD